MERKKSCKKIEFCLEYLCTTPSRELTKNSTNKQKDFVASNLYIYLFLFHSSVEPSRSDRIIFHRNMHIETVYDGSRFFSCRFQFKKRIKKLWRTKWPEYVRTGLSNVKCWEWGRKNKSADIVSPLALIHFFFFSFFCCSLFFHFCLKYWSKFFFSPFILIYLLASI